MSHFLSQSSPLSVALQALQSPLKYEEAEQSLPFVIRTVSLGVMTAKQSLSCNLLTILNLTDNLKPAMTDDIFSQTRKYFYWGKVYKENPCSNLKIIFLLLLF